MDAVVLADEDGTLKRVGAEFGLDIEFVRADYAETITLFAGGAVDAVVVTNTDAIPAVASAGVEADVLLVGSFSDGNDAIMLRPGAGNDLRGKTLGLVEYSVSHYLLDRYLEQANIPFDAVKWVNIADSAIAASFVSAAGGIDGAVTWNPIVDEIETRHGGRRLADSRLIRREIADMLVIDAARCAKPRRRPRRCSRSGSRSRPACARARPSCTPCSAAFRAPTARPMRASSSRPSWSIRPIWRCRRCAIRCCARRRGTSAPLSTATACFPPPRPVP